MTATRNVPLTDDRGRSLLDGNMWDEPLPGSVVLTDGQHGTAWQRFFSDGRWHPTRGGGSRTWAQMLDKRNLVLVYDAPVREEEPTIFKTNKNGAILGPHEALARAAHAHTEDGRCIKNRNGVLCGGEQR